MATFGAQLKQAREKQGVTLEEISLSTKIGTRMLRALEEEHFDQLPGGIFNKGFIRAYARCLGMDEDQAIADYLAATGVSPLAKKSEINEQAPILDPPPREENTAAGLPWGMFAVLLLIIALGFAAWGFYSRESERAPREATANSSGASSAAAEPLPSEQKPAAVADSPAATLQTDQQAAATKSAGCVDSIPSRQRSCFNSCGRAPATCSLRKSAASSRDQRARGFLAVGFRRWRDCHPRSPDRPGAKIHSCTE